MSKKKKKNEKSGRELTGIRHMPFTMLFRMVILICTLIVAIVAIVTDVYEPIVWTFLSAVAGYAALTNNRIDPPSKHA